MKPTISDELREAAKHGRLNAHAYARAGIQAPPEVLIEAAILFERVAEALEELDRRIERVRALHYACGADADVCEADSEAYPCETIQALEAAIV